MWGNGTKDNQVISNALVVSIAFLAVTIVAHIYINDYMCDITKSRIDKTSHTNYTNYKLTIFFPHFMFSFSIIGYYLI